MEIAASASGSANPPQAESRGLRSAGAATQRPSHCNTGIPARGRRCTAGFAPRLCVAFGGVGVGFARRQRRCQVSLAAARVQRHANQLRFQAQGVGLSV